MSTIINDEWKKPIHDFQGPVSIFLILAFKDYNGSVKWKKWKTKLHSSQCLACTGFDLPESPPICCVLQASEINTLVRLGNYRAPAVPFSPLEHNSQCVISHFLVSPQLNPNAILNFGKFTGLKRLWEFAAHRLQQPHCGPCTNFSSDPYKDHVPAKVVPNWRQDESLWHAYIAGIFRVLLHLSGLRGRP